MMSVLSDSAERVNQTPCEIALALASVSGIAVFPCSIHDKKPLTEHWPNDATTDRQQIMSWWTQYPDALIGVPTGPRNGIDVLDIDPPGERWFHENASRMPSTRAHTTRRGIHLLFKHSPGMRNSTSKIAPGVDVRGDGGYAIWWPALRDIEIAEWPGWLALEVAKACYSGPENAKEPRDLAPVDLTVADLVRLLQDMPNPASCGRDGYEHIMQSAAGARRGIAAHHGPISPADDDAITAAVVSWETKWPGWNDPDRLTKYGNDPASYAREKWETDWRKRGEYAGWDNLVSHAASLGMLDALKLKAEIDRRDSELTAIPLPTRDALLNRLGIRAWIRREIAPPDRLLGDLLTTTARVFLVGRTGLGKTNLALAIAVHLAAGVNFLHWYCGRAVRVLYLDGEMPPDLIRDRVSEAEQRLGREVPHGNLVVYSAVDGEAFAKDFPGIGIMPPLNSTAGHEWVKRFVQAFGGFDLIVFDNVMSLLSGDQKDELAWSETLPLVTWLTSQRIGQLWLDHTGHDASRQYGSSTKAWRMDAVGIMSPVTDDADADGDLSFKLSFDHPGKARRRTPRNWQDFADRVIRLSGDLWYSEAVTAHKDAKASRLTADEQSWLADIRAVFADKTAGQAVELGDHVKLHRDALRDGLKARGCFDLKETGGISDADRKALFVTLRKLKAKAAIGMSGDEIWLTD